ncbi:MAG: UDP-N-acetylglucosamine-N-acetylmuramyl-(pentapeptide) pyrophosphoryl-undecaprenol N-acetylglucosamine transferase [Candidatus Roizmanbacteria bacterium GW2011_GWA2_35_19]|uniref:UDP-N-acetylglucosamine-N-acetylmuramyl-(Pentapeptide) pyrophosphoryl-undecaprenol N-acetylglucosamine transferase n=1 Tax=Candidatus Roizmanbacteria bacterium GW2011_GWA2_35_19 TaxID=1618478 RepID=A0A0G0EF51_9BACT|nr:MAG: UDP-N-acetylglucosamine-N-acetylmuramyl-(pentapeptide) pyrophosphoryl-undecaprenol N-acetylglucosamine transferase [Candidatus Roizmanbacteria bacterium GW2011_GWA2_35_19]
MKILITGGHLAPALAIIEELKNINPNVEIIFVGRKYALDSEKTISLEYKEIEKLKMRGQTK